MDRDRSSRKSRPETDPDRDSGKDRDRDRKHRHDDAGDRNRRRSEPDRRRSRADSPADRSPDRLRSSVDRSKDEKPHRRHRRDDSPQDLEVQREKSVERRQDEKRRRHRDDSPQEREKSVERGKDEKRKRHRDDSLQDLVLKREKSVERGRDEKRRRRRDDSPLDLELKHEKSVERGKDEKRRRHRDDSPHVLEVKREISVERGKDEKRRRHRDDSPHILEVKRENSVDRNRESVERVKDEKHIDREEKYRGRGERYTDGARYSLERGKVTREDSVERHHRSSRKRKEYDGDEEDRDVRGKRVRDEPRDERRERRGFADRGGDDERNGRKDKVKDEPMYAEEDREKKNRVHKDEFDYGEDRKPKRERRRFDDRSNTDENVSNGRNGDLSNSASEKSGSVKISKEPLTAKVSTPSAAASLPIPTKVSSITTTNENGVNITRSDEVAGKSSTDGTTTLVPGRSGTLDVLAKAKKTLQLQKELNEKLKRIPMLNKSAPSKTGLNSQVAAIKVGVGLPTSVVAPTTSAITSAQVTQGIAKLENIPAAAGPGVIPGATGTNFEAVKRAQELAAKMGFRQDPEFAPLINMFPGPSSADVTIPEKPGKAPVLRIDAQGREVDEHGHVINMPKPTNLSTLKVNINQKKKDAFQILRPELDADTRSYAHFDPSMGIDKMKLLRPKRSTFQFVEEGRWSRQAETIKFKNQFGEAQAKELKMKQSQLAKAKGEVDNPNFIELPDRVDRTSKDKKKDDIPEIEWWDKPLLPLGSYLDVGGESCSMEKITVYVEHPRPIEPPAEPAPPPPQPLKLTKKEQKKLRTQRRLAKEKDKQEMIRQGLIEPPKGKVKMSNLMKVLGSEATQDPTRLEMEIRSAAAEREQAHVDRNIARKLTPAERREKKERKLFEDPNTLETFVSVYKIKDLTHPKTRFKVDVNAQENRLSGVAVISDGITVVVVEGGRKSINRYGKLMLNRIDWAAAVGDGEDGAEVGDMPVNSCGLVWQGSVARASFHRFVVHQCRTEAAAKKVFADAGVPHYWDLAVNFIDEVL